MKDLNQESNHEGKFICELCKKQLSSKQSLSQHLNTHSGSKPFICGHAGCNAVFSHGSKLSIHKKIHEPKQVNRKLRFDNFKDFIFLLLKALEVSKKKQFKLKKSQLKIKLPLISKVCFGGLLPLAKALRSLDT